MERETAEMGEATETIHREIAASREAIAQELVNSKNGWLACFLTRLVPIKGEIEFGNMNGEISDDKFREINGKIDALAAKAQKLRIESRDSKDIDDGLKEELLSELEALGQGL